MSNESLTDNTYELIENLERQRSWLKLVITGSILVVVSGLSIDGFLFMMFSHQKGGSYENMILVPILIIICLISAIIGITKVKKMRRAGNKLKQIELLEETIYKEVLATQKRSI